MPTDSGTRRLACIRIGLAESGATGRPSYLMPDGTSWRQGATELLLPLVAHDSTGNTAELVAAINHDPVLALPAARLLPVYEHAIDSGHSGRSRHVSAWRQAGVPSHRTPCGNVLWPHSGWGSIRRSTSLRWLSSVARPTTRRARGRRMSSRPGLPRIQHRRHGSHGTCGGSCHPRSLLHGTVYPSIGFLRLRDPSS